MTVSVDGRCPKCGYKFMISMDESKKANTPQVCPKCGKKLNIDFNINGYLIDYIGETGKIEHDEQP